MSMRLCDDGQMSADLMDIERMNEPCSKNTQWYNSDTESDDLSVDLGPGDNTHSSTNLVSQQGLIDIKLEPTTELSECSASQHGLIDIKLEPLTALCEKDMSSSACKYDVSSSSEVCMHEVCISEHCPTFEILHIPTVNTGRK